ncbi:hypothetical protein GCM10009839_19850 [Catenulispora yoronensis]|uniref:PknH-like extracellular domain-containing protein n=1 Tax=Catenulispora yoronensis TaxID=450799 RepID=A0ABN2TVX3_9ACTN
MLGIGPTLPAGWQAQTTHEQDSGPTATAPEPSLVSADDCNYLISDGLDLAKGLSVAAASEPVSSSSASAGVVLHAYRPGDAAKSLAQVRQNLASACNGFTVMRMGGVVDVDVSATPVPGLGDEALLVKVAPKGPYIQQEDLVVRHGNLTINLSANNALTAMPDLSPVAAALVAGMG